MIGCIRPPQRRLTREQRRALELLAVHQQGATDCLLVVAHGFETRMLAGLAHEGLAAAIVGEPLDANGKTVEVVRISITQAGRQALEGVKGQYNRVEMVTNTNPSRA
jgi:hypothetical protein